jgi:hypothetical protein
VYLDNDIELVENLDDIIRPSDRFVSVYAYKCLECERVWTVPVVFQAILAAAAKSPVIRRNMELFQQHASGVSVVPKSWADKGTFIMGRALQEMFSEGTRMLHEKPLPMHHPKLRGRQMEGCEYAVFNESEAVVAFSRVVHPRKGDSCYTNDQM